jgi:regulatory protein
MEATGRVAGDAGERPKAVRVHRRSRRQRVGDGDPGGVWRSDGGPVADDEDLQGVAEGDAYTAPESYLDDLPESYPDDLPETEYQPPRQGRGGRARRDRDEQATRTPGFGGSTIRDDHDGAVDERPHGRRLSARERDLATGSDDSSWYPDDSGERTARGYRITGEAAETWQGRRRSNAGPEDAAAREVTGSGGTEAQANDLCLRLLTERSRSRAELANMLAAKGFAADVAERTLERLAEVGFVDDAAFAEQWVHSRHTHAGKGKQVLAQELRRKGVADADARAALEAITSADEHDRAADLIRRKLSTLPPNIDRDKVIRRLTAMLVRRGYRPSTAFDVVTSELAAAGYGVADAGAEHCAEDVCVAGVPGSGAGHVAEDSIIDPAVNDSTVENSGARGPSAGPVADGSGRKARAAESHAVRGRAAKPTRTPVSDDPDAAAELVRRKLRSLPPNLERDKVVRRLVGVLARRGYGASVAYAVVEAELAAARSEGG